MLRPRKQPSFGSPHKPAPGMAGIEHLMGVASLLLLVLLGQPLYNLLIDHGPVELLHKPSLISHLEYARQQAVRLETPVTVCPSSDGRNCLAGGDWRQGWLIFTDASRPYRHFSVGDRFLHRQPGRVETQPLVAMDLIQYQADGSIRLN